MTWKTMTLTGWGRTSRAEVAACRPERAPAAIRTLGTRYEHGILAYGKGRSYGPSFQFSNDIFRRIRKQCRTFQYQHLFDFR